jgi:hypothetical protein
VDRKNCWWGPTKSHFFSVLKIRCHSLQVIITFSFSLSLNTHTHTHTHTHTLNTLNTLNTHTKHINHTLSLPSLSYTILTFLLRLINALKPGTIPKINEQNIAYMQMENIERYLQACRELGLRDTDLFNTSDLFNEKNMNLVLHSITTSYLINFFSYQVIVLYLFFVRWLIIFIFWHILLKNGPILMDPKSNWHKHEICFRLHSLNRQLCNSCKKISIYPLY